METFNVQEAKTHLSRLLARVEAGEEILISRYGQPVARLVPAQPAPRRRVGGTWKGAITIAEDFDDELPASWMSSIDP